eukprot:tig00001093_g6894.t1
MGFLKSVGRAFSSSQALKYSFQVTVDSATNFFEDVRSGGQLVLEWKRGEKIQQTGPGQLAMQEGLTAAVWRETLSLVSTIFKTSTGFESKESKFTVLLQGIDGRSRPLGNVYWNMADFVSAAPGDHRESVVMLLRAEGHKRAKKFIKGGLAEPSWDGIQLRVTITTRWLQDYKKSGNDDAASAYSDRTGVTATTADSAAAEDDVVLGSPRTLPTRSTLPLSSAYPASSSSGQPSGLAQRAEAIAARAGQAASRLQQWDPAPLAAPAAPPLAPDASREQLQQRVQMLEQANRQLRSDAEELISQLKNQQKTGAWLAAERERLLKALEEQTAGPTPLRATKDANAWLERDRERLIRELQSVQERHERAAREASARAREEARAHFEAQLREQIERLQEQSRTQWRGDAARLMEENADLRRRLEEALSRDKRASYSGEFVCTRCHTDAGRLRNSSSGSGEKGSGSLKSSIKGFLGGGSSSSGYGRRDPQDMVDESYVRSLQTDLIDAKMRLAYAETEKEEIKQDNFLLRRRSLLMEQEILKAKRILEQGGLAGPDEPSFMTLPSLPSLDGFAECLPSFGAAKDRDSY